MIIIITITIIIIIIISIIIIIVIVIIIIIIVIIIIITIIIIIINTIIYSSLGSTWDHGIHTTNILILIHMASFDSFDSRYPVTIVRKRPW